VGALLEARAFHPGRSARSHLLALAATHGIPRSRVDQLISLVGLEEVARMRAGGCSLGMGQRLGIVPSCAAVRRLRSPLPRCRTGRTISELATDRRLPSGSMPHPAQAARCYPR
jgi:hypothetical protein